MQRSPPKRRTTDAPNRGTQTVLVVDDSRAMRSILSRVLEEAGFEVKEAEDGRQGLGLCRSQLPDLMLLDVDMPVMDGIETIKAMRADPELSSVPVLFLTARTNSDEAARGLELGARDYVRKPCPPDELVARVSTALRLRAQELELLEQKQRLDDLSAMDPLTGLGNRRRLTARLRELQERNGAQASIGVMMVDLDLFKSVNDTHGHGVGDTVLQVVAGRLMTAVGPTATVVRWGGEEFLVVSPQPAWSDLAAAGDQLRLAIGGTPLSVGLPEGLTVTVSVGCSSGPVGNFDATVASADAALYQAKHLGRNRVQVA